MLSREVEVVITCNGQNMTDTVSGCLTGISYSDPADGESDTLDVTFSDREGKWLNEWFPKKEDILTAEIRVHRLNGPDDADWTINFGEFILDSFSFSGEPLEIKLSAVSSPVNRDFKATKRTKTWENVTLQEIAQDIAGRAGIELIYEADTIEIKAEEQEETEDSTFLKNLCDRYNVAMKVFTNRLILFSIKEYRAKSPVAEITRQDVISWSWETDLQGSYTGAKISYTDPYSNKTIEYQTGTDERLLEVSESADSQADAKLKAEAALEEANRNITKMQVTVPGRVDIFASDCVTVSGFGKLDGKYYVEKHTPTLMNGFTSQYDMTKVEEQEG